MTQGGDVASYDSVLAQNVQLKIDLQSSLSELSRKEEDNATLKQLHESLQELYRRLQEERDALKRRLRHDQAEIDEVLRRTQGELARLREQLRSKCRECEELQHQALSPQELTRWRRRLEEELREAELEPIRRQLEGQIAEAQGHARNLERLLEQERARAKMMEAELKDKLDVETTASRGKEQILERSKATLEAERRKSEDLELEVSRLQQQLDDQETRFRGLREQLQARELQSQQEQLVWKQELDRKVSDEQQMRRENQQLKELRHEESLRAEKQLQSFEAQAEELRQQQKRSEDAEVQVKTLRMEMEQEARRYHEGLAKHRAEGQEEVAKHEREMKAMEERIQATELSKKALEVHHEQLLQEKLEHFQENEEAHEQARDQLLSENEKLRAQLKKTESEQEGRRQSWHLKEAELLKQVEALATKLENFTDELAHCKVAQQDCERRLKEAHSTHAQREEQFKTQLSSIDDAAAKMKSQVSKLESERQEQARLAEDNGQKLRTCEAHCQDLKDEVLHMSSRQEQERREWRKQLDEAQAALESAEQTCTQRLQAMAEDHKKQLQTLNSKQKRSLSKAKAQLQERHGKCKDLTKHVAQLQSEKAVAVRVCEENKRFYELRLAEHAAVASSPRRWRDASPEMRDLADRHDEHERQLRLLRGE